MGFRNIAAGGNTYHGGHSFSLFVTRGSEKNHSTS